MQIEQHTDLQNSTNFKTNEVVPTRSVIDSVYIDEYSSNDNIDLRSNLSKMSNTKPTATTAGNRITKVSIIDRIDFDNRVKLARDK